MKNITKKMIITLCAFNLIACVPSQNEIKGAAPKSSYVPSYPSNYEAEIKIYLKKYLKDYESVKGFEIISEPKVGVVNYGAFAKGPEGKSFGNKIYLACAGYNAKNSYGGYVGYEVQAFFFDNNGKVIKNSESDRPEADMGISKWSC